MKRISGEGDGSIALGVEGEKTLVGSRETCSIQVSLSLNMVRVKKLQWDFFFYHYVTFLVWRLIGVHSYKLRVSWAPCNFNKVVENIFIIYKIIILNFNIMRKNFKISTKVEMKRLKYQKSILEFKPLWNYHSFRRSHIYPSIIEV